MTGEVYTPIEMIRKLISFDTTSRDSNLALISFVADYLSGHGVPSTLIPDPSGKKANLYATLGPTDVPGIVLSGHTDVVPVDGQKWETDPFEMVEKQGRLYGRGTADMKSFVAIGLSLVPDFMAQPLAIPIHFALSYDEEVGCLGAPLMIERMGDLAAMPQIVIVGEPTNMCVVNAHKGVYSFHTMVTGLEQHSSRTDQGVNAVQYAARIISFLVDIAIEMRDERDKPDSGFTPGYTTVHVGTVQGGTAQNIVPRKCAFTWEYRLLPGEDPDEIRNRYDALIANEILPAMHKVDPNTGVETEVRAVVPGLVPENGSPAEELVLKLAQRNATEVVAYGTEAGQFQSAGVPTVICGPGDIAQAHKPDEFIEISQIEACIGFMGRLKDVCVA